MLRSFYLKTRLFFKIKFSLILFFFVFFTGQQAFSSEENLVKNRSSNNAAFKNTSAASWTSASFPVENFQKYTSGFGNRINPVTGKKQFHTGIDIAAPLGSYVRAWWSGQIVGLSDNTICGTKIRIQSGRWSHIYCHLAGHVQTNSSGTYLVDRSGGIVLKLGQVVPVGARIGRVGMTGRTTGPHLHWTLKYNNKLQDPAWVLQQMYCCKK